MAWQIAATPAAADPAAPAEVPVVLPDAPSFADEDKNLPPLPVEYVPMKVIEQDRKLRAKLPKAVRDQAFRPFQAVDVEGARPGGIGLGLAFAREVALAHDGDVVIADTSEGGTTMQIHLPIRMSASRSAA